MDFIRRYLFELACGVVGVAGIVAGAIAYTGYSDVRAELSDAASLARQLEQYRGPRDLCNKQVIAAELQRNEQVDRQLEQVTEAAKQMNQHQPLRDDVFPEPLTRRQDSPFLFRTDYRERFKQLLNLLQAGDAPDPDEIQDMQERINQEQRIPEDQVLGLTPSAGTDTGRLKPADSVRPKNVGGSWDAGDGEVSVEELARTDAAIRAALVKAARIRIYANLDSFDIIDNVYTEGLQPTSIDMWSAQMKLWVQENVVRGLAEANEQAVQRIEADGGRANVANLPVKHLLSITVTNYVEPTDEVGAMAGGGKGGDTRGIRMSYAGAGADAIKMSGGSARGSSGRLGGAAGSFTQRASNDLYDVVQCRMEMVVDARELLRVINAICRQDFITPIGVSFEAMEPDTTFTDYIYGSAPIVQATVDFECCFFRELCEPLMPEDVKMLRGMTSAETSPAGRTAPSGAMYRK
ncbi:MAG TPA: hypothetical protein VMZ31_03465 [Phycisphaerae bacterium]|nr:hypothetical protein [Phycisphaerae bacterium]